MIRIKKSIEFLFINKFILLFITLIAQIFVPVFFVNYLIHDALSYLFISFTLIASVLIFKNIKRHKLYILFVVFIILVLLINWIDYFNNDQATIHIQRIILIGSTYVVVFVNIFTEFSNRKEVNFDFIFGAISAYLILGIISSFISVIIDNYYPGSFSFIVSPADFQDHLYFNFVTLTTLGYGDILPITPQGQMHSVAVALTGQLYLTVIIGLIIGSYLSISKK